MKKGARGELETRARPHREDDKPGRDGREHGDVTKLECNLHVLGREAGRDIELFTRERAGEMPQKGHVGGVHVRCTWDRRGTRPACRCTSVLNRRVVG